MKYITVSLALLTLMVGLCIVSSTCVIKAVDNTISLLEDAVTAEDTGKQDKTISLITKASETWRKQETFFGTVLRHDEIDDVTEEFARLKSYATTEDQDDFLSNCRALIAKLEHIKSMERPTFENIM